MHCSCVHVSVPYIPAHLIGMQYFRSSSYTTSGSGMPTILRKCHKQESTVAGMKRTRKVGVPSLLLYRAHTIQHWKGCRKIVQAAKQILRVPYKKSKNLKQTVASTERGSRNSSRRRQQQQQQQQQQAGTGVQSSPAFQSVTQAVAE